jgi:hypothetical protein
MKLLALVALFLLSMSFSAAADAVPCPDDPNRCLEGQLQTVQAPDRLRLIVEQTTIERVCLYVRMDNAWYAVRTDDAHTYKETRTIVLMAKLTGATVRLYKSGRTVACGDGSYPEIGGMALK